MSGTGVELLFGPMLIGLLFSTAVYGVMSVQMLLYYQMYKKDAAWIRYFVFYLFIAESVNLAVQVGIVYEPLIVRYGAQHALIVSPLLLPGDAISIVMASTPIQLFTAWRISVITGSIVIPLLISVLAIISFGGGLLVTVFVSIRNEFQQFQSFSWAVIIWLVSSAVVDVLIAAKLTHSLSSRKTGFSAMDGQINRIIRLTVQTGAITAVVALADVILFLVFPTTTLQFIVDFPLSKLYTICLLSTLNARSRGRSEDVEQRMPNALFRETTSTHHSGTRTETTVHVAKTTYPPPPPANMYTIDALTDTSDDRDDPRKDPRRQPRF
ncbi:hypothetical protein C8R46DRAFT_1104322 [Mycena filopes]|nr:hypothetical protein C8R46DRAFT_1202944 [Mycena filopes]KAJ7162323.1 hypothetical protein C8R46DRAFT_1104322 [Mycena filopes]